MKVDHSYDERYGIIAYLTAENPDYYWENHGWSDSLVIRLTNEEVHSLYHELGRIIDQQKARR